MALTPVAVPALVMLAVGLWGIDRGSTWFDEEMSLDVSRRTVPQIWALAHHVDAVHAAYYLLMHVWLLPGGGEVWLRLPSALAASAAAGLVAALGVRLVGPRAGLLAGLVFAGVPVVSFYAQEGRSYSLVGTAVLASTYCLVRAVDPLGATRRWWLGYAAAVVVAQTLNELAILVLAAHATTLLISRVPRAVWLRWSTCALVCELCVLPLVLVSSGQAEQVGWLPRPTWSTVLELARAFLGPSPLAAGVLGGLASAGLAVRRRGPISLPGLAVPLLVGPPGLLMLAAQVQPLYHERYVLFSVAAVPLLAGAGLDRLAARLPRSARSARAAGCAGPVGCAAVLVLVLVAEVPGLLEVRTVESRPEDLAAAARVVGREARPGDGVLYLRPLYRAAELACPAAFADVTDLTLARSPAGSDTLVGIERDPAATRAAVLGVTRVWVLGRPGLRVSPSFADATRNRRLLATYFRVVRRYRLHGLEVALLVRR